MYESVSNGRILEKKDWESSSRRDASLAKQGVEVKGLIYHQELYIE